MSLDKTLPARAPSRLPWIALWCLLGGLWGLVFYHIHMEWIVNVVYSYGWAVPVLAAYLFRERWLNRPLPGSTWSRWLVIGLVAALLTLYLPVRVIQEANPDWVKINWSMVGIAAGLSLVAVGAIGGLRYVFFFSFPILFCFTALPWPVWMETYLLQTLMRGNAQICAEVLTQVGLPAIAQGNLIQIANRIVNVEEACSGIRSLQTAFMMSLFLGEFYRLGVVRRIALLGLALGVAALGNVARTIVLAYCASQDTLDRWHDTVGNVSMVVTLAGVWAAAEWVRRRKERTETTSPAVLPSVALTPILPAWLAAAGVLWLGLAEVATQVWYRSHERRVTPGVTWQLQWPERSPDFKTFPFHERSQALMKFDQGENVAWTDAAGHRWQAYRLSWEPGRVSKYLAMSHYPTVCLPATGLTLVAETGSWDFEDEGVRLPFSTYVFSEGGQDVFVFHAIVEDRPLEEKFTFRYYQVGSMERIASVLRGERNLGQKVIGIALRGCDSPSEAREVVAQGLRRMVVPFQSERASSL